MSKDIAARKRIRELSAAIGLMTEHISKMSSIMLKCSKAFETLIEKGIITNDEIQEAFDKKSSNSDTNSKNPDELQVQSEGIRADESDS